MAVWSVVHQDPVPPIAQHVGLPRRFAVHGGCHETARPALALDPDPGIAGPNDRVAGVPPRQRAQPFAGGQTLFAKLAIQQHLVLAARQLRQVGHGHRLAIGLNTTQGVSFQFVWTMHFDEFPQVGIGRETRPPFLAMNDRLSIESGLVHLP